MKKFKSVFKIDFTTTKEATDFYFNMLRHGDIKTAREETRKRYGLATVHIMAATDKNAIEKFNREFNKNYDLTYTNYECVICGNTL